MAGLAPVPLALPGRLDDTVEEGRDAGGEEMEDMVREMGEQRQRCDGQERGRDSG